MGNDKAISYRRRRQRVKRKIPIARSFNNFIRGLFLVMMISTILSVIIVTVYHERNGYALAVENIEKWEDNTKNLASQVGDATKESETLALELYITVGEYVRSTEDVTLIRLYERALPETPEEFQSDLVSNMISVLAFLESHEDIKHQVDVAQALYDLEVSQDYRNRLISRYNESVDSYNFWVSEYRDTFIYRHFKSKRIETENFVKYAVSNGL